MKTTHHIELLPNSFLNESKHSLVDPAPELTAPPLKINGTLEKYIGPWNKMTSKHLLFRGMFGPTKDQIEMSESIGLDATIDKLFESPSLAAPPINYDNQLDPFAGIGDTWVDKKSLPTLGNSRRRSLRAWITGLMVNEGMSINEKMTLFWHNHFVVSEINEAKFEFQYWELLRKNALGNFRTFAKEVTTNPAMLFYLNGNRNTKNAPNENYARELFELFTVGKGPLAGPGDYTTFTEKDVAEAAKILTGWKVDFTLFQAEMPEPRFVSFIHDQTTKTLSHRFGNAIIENGGASEFETLIDVIFQNPDPAKFLARKLYRWFVYYHIDEVIEQNIIEPLAQVIIDNDYEIVPALRVLLSSEHFFDENSIGCQIKNPVDFIVNNVKQFEIKFDAPIVQQNALWYGIFQAFAIMQMIILDIPAVAGWKAFYQEPTFNRLWINSFTLPLRRLYSDTISTVGYDLIIQRFRIDAFKAIENLSDPLDPNILIEELAFNLLPIQLNEAQVSFLKEVLIPGLPDIEWTIEYNAYLVDPDNEEIKLAVEAKLRAMLRAMLSMAEYHLQ